MCQASVLLEAQQQQTNHQNRSLQEEKKLQKQVFNNEKMENKLSQKKMIK